MDKQMTAFEEFPETPHPSILVSALQKYLRRSETEKAVRTAATLLGDPDKQVRQRVVRRLPIIVVEDLGWEYLARVGERMRGWTYIGEPKTDVYAVIGGLCSVSHTKECGWLMDMGRDAVRWKGTGGATAPLFQLALTQADPIESMRIARVALNERRFWAKDGDDLAGVLYDLAKDPMYDGSLVPGIVSTALWRARAGGMFDDQIMLVAAAILAIVDAPTEEPEPWHEPAVFEPEPEPMLKVDWYATDMHTYIGKQALRAIGEKYGVPYKTLVDAMFFYESAKLNPERPSRWKAEAHKIVAREGKWPDLSPARMEELWRRYGPLVEAEIRAKNPGLVL